MHNQKHVYIPTSCELTHLGYNPACVVPSSDAAIPTDNSSNTPKPKGASTYTNPFNNYTVFSFSLIVAQILASTEGECLRLATAEAIDSMVITGYYA